MDAAVLKKLFEVNHRAYQVNVDGITHEQSIQQPPGGGNCVNWVAGHIVASRNAVLKILGEEPIWPPETAAHYARGSAGIRGGAEALRLDSILADLARAQDRITAALGRLSPEDFARESDGSTRGFDLAFAHFHEAHHIGQLGVLRRFLGKEGGIK